MADITRISGNAPWEPIVGYCRAVKAGPWIAVSGTTATDENGRLVGVNQMYVQARQAIANIERALGRAGAGLSNVIRTRIFVTDMSRFGEVGRAHKEAFGDHPPAATAVEVRRLVHPDMLVEIEVDAFIGADAGAAPSKPALRKPKAAAARKSPRPKPKRRR
jgi:enamine deaminase RidA (YjgF/YER057c/UK114 family)